MPFIFDDFHFCRSRVIGLDMTENRIFTLCRMITWEVFLRMFWNFISSLPVKRGGSLSYLTGKNSIFCHIKSNNSGMAKVKIVKYERDPPLFTGKLLIKFQNILRNTDDPFYIWRFSLLPFQNYWTWYDRK
jgi:hypothetical protein